MHSEADLYWLAGILEGEGTFLAGPPSAPSVPRIRVEMTDADVVERVAGMFNRTMQQHAQRPGHTKPTASTTVKGASAVQLMRLIRPVLGERRRARIDEILAQPHAQRVRWLRPAQQCGVVGCARNALTRSLCKQHYQSWWKKTARGKVSSVTPSGPPLPGIVLDLPGPGDAGAMHWLAGLLEGEGCFASSGSYPHVSVHMCDRGVVARAAALMGARSVREATRERDRAAGWSRSYVASVVGARAAVLMRELRPLLALRRGTDVDCVLAAYVPVRLTSAPPTCVAQGCIRPHRSRGLCNTHYMKWSRDRALGRAPRVMAMR